MAKEEVRSRLELRALPFGLIMQHLAKSNLITEEGPTLRLKDHTIELSKQQKDDIARYLNALSITPFSPPAGANIEAELFNYLLEDGQIVRTSPEAVFTAQAYNDMVSQVVAALKAQGTVTVGQVRDMLGTSRKYVLGLLEYMDQQRITRRIGDERVLR